MTGNQKTIFKQAILHYMRQGIDVDSAIFGDDKAKEELVVSFSQAVLKPQLEKQTLQTAASLKVLNDEILK